MFSRISLLAVAVSAVVFSPLCNAQDPKPLFGKWTGDVELAKKHYKDSKQKINPRLLETLEFLTIEFNADKKYVFSHSKSKLNVNESFEFLPKPEAKKNEFTVRVQRNGPPPQVWHCKIVQIEKKEALLMTIKGRPTEELVMVRAKPKADKDR